MNSKFQNLIQIWITWNLKIKPFELSTINRFGIFQYQTQSRGLAFKIKHVKTIRWFYLALKSWWLSILYTNFFGRQN